MFNLYSLSVQKKKIKKREKLENVERRKKDEKKEKHVYLYKKLKNYANLIFVFIHAWIPLPRNCWVIDYYQRH